ncbi:MAG TPA: hypothetical protein VF896_19545 [Anaerolineales bacterium]
MNHWQNEFMAEYRRQEILDEAEQIRLERAGIQAHLYRPRFFERTMYNFANWMISTGKQLRKRYEIPAVNCNHRSTGSYAH